MPSINLQQWKFGLDNSGTPQLYELTLQHDSEMRTYFLNGKMIKNFSVPPNKAGTTRDIFEFDHSKIRMDIERVKNKFLYKLKVNNQTLSDHTQKFNQQYTIWKWEERSLKGVIILDKTSGNLYANGDKVAALGDGNYAAFNYSGSKIQLLATRKRTEKEFTLLRQNVEVKEIALEGTGDKVVNAAF